MLPGSVFIFAHDPPFFKNYRDCLINRFRCQTAGGGANVGQMGYKWGTNVGQIQSFFIFFKNFYLFSIFFLDFACGGCILVLTLTDKRRQKC